MQDELRAVFVDGPRRPSAPMRAEPNHTDVTVSGRVHEVDEASADASIRTLRPPVADANDGAIDVEVDMDEPSLTMRNGLAVTQQQAQTRGLEDENEEETATMELNPALRARIEAMTRPAEPIAPEDASRSSRPPPTRPLRPPRRR